MPTDKDLGAAILRVVNAVGAVVAAVLTLVLVLKSAESQQPIIITSGGQVVDAQPTEEVVARGTGYNVPCYFEQGGAQITLDAGCTLSSSAGSAVNLASANVAGTLTVTNLVSQSVGTNAAYITATSALSTASLSVGGYTQSGAVRFGSASVVSGTTVAHGFGVTPTSFIVQNAVIQSDVFTQALYSGGCNTTSCTIYFTQGAITTTTANWMAGK